MPIYEYECKNCGKFVEKLLKKHPKTTKCPSCSRRMTRVMSPSNFQLKGSCWAKDSYGLKEKKKNNKPKTDKGGYHGRQPVDQARTNTKKDS